MLTGNSVLIDFDDRPDAAERQARSLSTLKLTRAPGAEFEYSNLNYSLLGLIVEAASGESYASYIEKHIFVPLEMTHSYTAPAEAKRDGLAVGHRYWFGYPIPAPNLPIPRGSLAAGQLISCSQDMAHYLMAHLNGGRYKDNQILSPAGIAELHRAGVEFSAMGDAMGYAMGWFTSQAGPVRIVSHAGNVPDFSSFMALVPEQNKGIVLLLNADPTGIPFVLMEVGAGAAALLAGQPREPIKFGLIPLAFRALPLIPLAQIVGVASTLRMLRRWRRDPKQRPSRASVWVQHLLLPLLPNLSLAALPLLVKDKGPLEYIRVFNPDVYWTAILCGGFAGLWAFLRTGLILRALREP